jgi:hypothetical protein
MGRSGSWIHKFVTRPDRFHDLAQKSHHHVNNWWSALTANQATVRLLAEITAEKFQRFRAGRVYPNDISASFS